MSGVVDGSTPAETSAVPVAAPADAVADETVSPATGSAEARRLAGLVLEVLAGVRTPAEVAGVLGVATNRYYQLETRALAALVAGCEPRPRGPQIDYRTRWERERESVARLTQEVARLTALLRTAQQTFGVAPMPADRRRQAQAAKRAGKRAKRRPSVRALKARDRLDERSAPRRPTRGRGSEGADDGATGAVAATS